MGTRLISDFNVDTSEIGCHRGKALNYDVFGFVASVSRIKIEDVIIFDGAIRRQPYPLVPDRLINTAGRQPSIRQT